MLTKYVKNVATLTIDAEKCAGCGICVNVCPHQILSVKQNKCDVADKDLCMECGACMLNCPFNAIYVEKGVGCFTAIVNGVLTGKEPSCDCSGENGSCC